MTQTRLKELIAQALDGYFIHPASNRAEDLANTAAALEKFKTEVLQTLANELHDAREAGRLYAKAMLDWPDMPKESKIIKGMTDEEAADRYIAYMSASVYSTDPSVRGRITDIINELTAAGYPDPTTVGWKKTKWGYKPMKGAINWKNPSFNYKNYCKDTWDTDDKVADQNVENRLNSGCIGSR